MLDTLLWSIISADHMTPLRDHPVIHYASTNKHTARRKRGAALWVESTDPLGANSEGLAQPAQRRSAGEKKKQNRMYKIEHVAYLCI